MSGPILGFQDLVTEMQGNDTLNGWDVLVSYRIDQLNVLLWQRAQQDTGQSSIDPFDATVAANPFDKTLQQTYTMNLQISSPEMKFVAGTDAGVQLTFQLSGTATNKSTNEQINLASGTSLQVTTSLVHIEGSILSPSSGTSTPTTVKNPANFVILVEPGSTHSICIDLTNPSVQIVPQTADGQPAASGSVNADSLNAAIVSGIVNYFQTCNGLQFQLAGLNAPAENAGLALQPTAFCFTTVSGTSSNTQSSGSENSTSHGGALLMWIGVSGGANNGLRQSGQTSLNFQPAGDVRSPIPTGRYGSIIFSHNIIMESFIKPGLTNLGFTDITAEDAITQEGITVSLNCPPMLSQGTTQNVLYVPSGQSTLWGDSPGLNIDVSATAAELQIRSPLILRGAKLPTLKHASQVQQSTDNSQEGFLVWASPKQSFSWTTTQMWQPPSHNSETVHIFFAARASWTSSSGTSSQNQLNMIWTIDSNFTVHDKHSGDSSLFGDWQPALPSTFNMNTEPLNYFLVTNLLFPGDCVFLADDPSATTLTQGLAVPRDIILTGALVQLLPSNSASVPMVALMEIPTPSQEQALVPRANIGSPSQAAQTPTQQDVDQLLQSFLRDLTDSSPSSLFFKLLNAFQGDDADTQAQNLVSIVKNSPQYGSLTGDQIGSLIGWDWARFSAWAEANGSLSPSSTPGTPTTSAAPNPALAEPDILALSETTSRSNRSAEVILDGTTQNSVQISALWEKVYNVDSSSDELVIFPDGKSVSYPYSGSSSPTAVFTAFSPDKITWKDVGGNTYNITFSAAPDPTTYVFHASFMGNCTDSSGNITPFSGTEAVPKAPSASDGSTAQTIFDYFSGALGILGSLVAFYQIRPGSEAKFLGKVAAKVTEVLDDRRKKGVEAITEAMTRFTQEKANSLVNEGLGVTVKNSINVTVKDQLSNLGLDNNALRDLGTAVVSGAENANLKKIKDAVTTEVNTILLTAVDSPVLPVLIKEFQPFIDAGLVDAGSIGGQPKAFVDTKIMPQLTADKAGAGAGSNFLNQQFKSALLKLTSEAINTSLTTVIKTVESNTTQLDTAKSNLRTLETQFSNIEAQESSPDQQQALENAKEQIIKQKAEVEKWTNAQQAATDEKTGLENSQREQTTEQKTSEESANDLGKDIFRGE